MSHILTATGKLGNRAGHGYACLDWLNVYECKSIKNLIKKWSLDVPEHSRTKRGVVVRTALCLLLVTSYGCANVGPRSIISGRLNYAEAINRTDNQQMLLSIVKGRYGDNSTLLAVTGVAANIRFRVAAGVEAGFDVGVAPPGENLITGGVAYEENPTITYSPVSGEQYVRQLLAPIPLDLLILSLRSQTIKGSVLTLLVNRVNDLQNPDFLEARSAERVLRFKRFVELFTELSREGILDVFRSPREDSAFDLLIRNSAPQYFPAVVELLALLDLQAPENMEKDIIIPIYFSVNPNKSWGVWITTRSTFDLVEMLRAAVVVPEEHVLAGLTIDYPPIGLPMQGVRINSSTSKPEGSSLAVKFRGYWFYISETDRATKAAYNMARTLWSITIASSTDESKAPVLTIPVGR